MAQESLMNIHQRVTTDYLAKINPANPPTPRDLQDGLLEEIRNDISLVNELLPKDARMPLPRHLLPVEVAQIMATLHHVCLIPLCDSSQSSLDDDQLAIYQADGDNKGTYTLSDDIFRRIARLYHYDLDDKYFAKVMTALRDCDLVPRRSRSGNRNHIAVNNGIFDYESKTLLPFTPEEVFFSKSHVDYNPNATNVVIHNADDGTDWDVESWMESLSDDPEIVNLLWEIIGAIIRPGVDWNKTAWMYSEKGNNGKGTLCALMRNICGPGTATSIPISHFGKDFMLEPLMRASAVIVDENDVGIYIDSCSALKTVITHDPIQINRKYKPPVTYTFDGFMVQCLNEYPRVKDKSESFARRLLFIPMTKCFTGRERKYIKSDYLARTEVLEYVLKRVLNMNFYSLSEPASCKLALQEYQMFNDPLRQFWDDVQSRFAWSLLPYTFLYELYRAWIKQNNPVGKELGRTAFIKDLSAIVEKSDEWRATGRTPVHTGHRMDDYEPLIQEYNLTTWMNPAYKGNDPTVKCRPLTLAENYRGVVRK